MDLLAVEEVVGALGYGPSGDLLAREGDQGLAAALATEVIQDEYGVWLELQEKKKKTTKKNTKKLLIFMQVHHQKTRGSPHSRGWKSSPQTGLIR